MKTKLLCASLVVGLLAGCAQPVKTQTTYYKDSQPRLTITRVSKPAQFSLIGAAGDSITTRLALAAGGSEKNPLINTSTGGLITLFALKAGLVYYLDRQDPQTRERGLKLTGSLWGGVTASNLLIALGATNPVAIAGGLATGIYAYNYQAKLLLDERSLTQQLAAKIAQK